MNFQKIIAAKNIFSSNNQLKNIKKKYDSLEMQALKDFSTHFFKNNTNLHCQEIHALSNYIKNSFVQSQNENRNRLIIQNPNDSIYTQYDFPDHANATINKILTQLNICSSKVNFQIKESNFLQGYTARAYDQLIIFNKEKVDFTENNNLEDDPFFLYILLHELNHVLRNHSNYIFTVPTPTNCDDQIVKESFEKINYPFYTHLIYKASKKSILDENMNKAAEYNADIQIFLNEKLDIKTLSKILLFIQTLQDRKRPSIYMPYKQLYKEGSEIVSLKKELERLRLHKLD